MPPGQLALRREQAIDLLEELTQLRGRHEALREALRRVADEDQKIDLVPCQATVALPPTGISRTPTGRGRAALSGVARPRR